MAPESWLQPTAETGARQGSGPQTTAGTWPRARETLRSPGGDGGAQRQRETGRGADTSGGARRRLPVQLRLRGKDAVCAAISGEEPGVRGEGENGNEEGDVGEAEEREQEQAKASEEDEEREQREQQEQASEEDEEPCPATMLDVFRSIPTQMVGVGRPRGGCPAGCIR